MTVYPINVSVIIPIYNVEKYIERCARSLFEQTLENIEFIFVNDCTPDKSMALLDIVITEFPQRKEQIKIINHEVKRGIAAVRNTGLDNAIGEYIGWVDSDDWVEKDMFELMYHKAKEEFADMVFCDYCWIGNSWLGIRYDTMVSPSLCTKDKRTVIKSLTSNEISGALWFKLTKRDIFVNNRIRFIEGANMIEDFAVSIQLVHNADKISHVPKCAYYYNRYNNASLSVINNKEQICRMVKESLVNLDSIQPILKLYGNIRKEIIHRYLIAIAPYLELDDKELRYLWRSKCKFNVFQIAKDDYFPIGYRLKYVCVKIGVFPLYNIYVRLRKKILNHKATND